MLKILLIILSLVMMLSCSKTQILNAPMLQIDTLSKAHKGFAKDTTARHKDTTRMAMEFNATVEGWNNSTVNLGK